MIKRIENRIEKLIRDENNDGIIRYFVKGFSESGM